MTETSKTHPGPTSGTHHHQLRRVVGGRSQARRWLSVVAVACLLMVTVQLAPASSAVQDEGVVAWGEKGWVENGWGQTDVPVEARSGVTAISTGFSHSLALKNDGTVVAWGDNQVGQASVPDGLSGVTAIAAGYSHSLALKNDGTVVAWGYDSGGQTHVPDGLSGVTAIAAGGNFSLALKNDGTVVAWGSNSRGQTSVPSDLSGVIAISAGASHSLALTKDGTVVAWGSDLFGETDVPSDLSDVTAIAAGYRHSLALRRDGTVVAWADYNGTELNKVPDGLTGVTAIAAGKDYSVALKGDGTIVAWGDDDYGNLKVPDGLSGVTAIAAGIEQSLALRLNVAPGQPTITAVTAGDGEAEVSFTPGPPGLPAQTSFSVTAVATGGVAPTKSSSAAGSPATLTGLTNGVQYTFTVTASNTAGSTTSGPSSPVVVGTAPTISGTPPGGTVGTPYRFAYTLTGAPAPVTIVPEGTLPAGLSLGLDGVLSGTPTRAGTSTFTVVASNAVGAVTTKSTVTIAAAPPPPTPPRPPTVDTGAAGFRSTAGSSVSTSKLSTAGPGELLVAYVATDGPRSGTQKVTGVSGGGLTWKLAARSNTSGTTEVWQAYATGRFSGTVTASYGSGYDAAIAVVAYKNAATTVGATAVGSGTGTTSSVRLATTRPNSLVWAAGHNATSSAAPVPKAGQRLVYQSDRRTQGAYWLQATPATPSAGTVVTVADTLPQGSRWDMAAVEITTP